MLISKIAVILTLRTWAVWDRNRRVAIALAVFFAICWLPVIPVIITFVKSLECKRSPSCLYENEILKGYSVEVYTTPSRGLSGCLVTQGASIVFLVWLLLLVYEAGGCLVVLIASMFNDILC
jgi:hypothetical protein